MPVLVATRGLSPETVEYNSRRVPPLELSRPRLGEVFDLAPGGNLIGRAGDEAAVLLPSISVSRRHARVFTDGDDWFVEDLRSRNHTFLDGREVEAPTPLLDGGRLRITEYELLFRYEPFDRGWLTGDVLALARSVAEDRAFDRLPILADALTEAGCNDEWLLRLCRSRACRSISLILDSENASEAWLEKRVLEAWVAEVVWVPEMVLGLAAVTVA